MSEPEVAPWRGRYLLYAVGVLLIVVGGRGIAANAQNYINPSYWAKLFVGGALGHDLLLTPVVFIVAYALLRVVPGIVRRYVASGLIVSGVLVAVAWPGVRRYGLIPDNPSIHPLNYARGLLITLSAVWGVLLVAAVVDVLRRRSARPAGPLDAPPA